MSEDFWIGFWSVWRHPIVTWIIGILFILILISAIFFPKGLL